MKLYDDEALDEREGKLGSDEYKQYGLETAYCSGCFTSLDGTYPNPLLRLAPIHAPCTLPYMPYPTCPTPDPGSTIIVGTFTGNVGFETTDDLQTRVESALEAVTQGGPDSQISESHSQ